MKMGFFEYLCASSARQRIAAAEPSLTPEQSKMPSMPATGADFVMVSIGTSLRNCAFGFLAPFLWFFQAMRARTCFSSASSTPYFLAYAGASRENVAGAVMLDRVPSVGGVDMLRPEYPESFSFSTPIAITRSYAPLATA